MKTFISEVVTVILIALTLQGLVYFSPQPELRGLATVEKTYTMVPEQNQPVVEFPINLNSAAKYELMALNGIGEKTADKIIDYRSEHHHFITTQEIMQISGIGASKFDKIRADIYVDLKSLGMKIVDQ